MGCSSRNLLPIILFTGYYFASTTLKIASNWKAKQNGCLYELLQSEKLHLPKLQQGPLQQIFKILSQLMKKHQVGTWAPLLPTVWNASKRIKGQTGMTRVQVQHLKVIQKKSSPLQGHTTRQNCWYKQVEAESAYWKRRSKSFTCPAEGLVPES